MNTLLDDLRKFMTTLGTNFNIIVGNNNIKQSILINSNR